MRGASASSVCVFGGGGGPSSRVCLLPCCPPALPSLPRPPITPSPSHHSLSHFQNYRREIKSTVQTGEAGRGGGEAGGGAAEEASKQARGGGGGHQKPRGGDGQQDGGTFGRGGCVWGVNSFPSATRGRACAWGGRGGGWGGTRAADHHIGEKGGWGGVGAKLGWVWGARGGPLSLTRSKARAPRGPDARQPSAAALRGWRGGGC